jgi:hypothetical protein
MARLEAVERRILHAVSQRQRPERPLRDRLEPTARLIAAGTAVLFAAAAVGMLLVAVDPSAWAAAGVSSRSEALWASLAAVAAAAFGVIYAWKGSRWIEGLLGRVAWPTRSRGR